MPKKTYFLCFIFFMTNLYAADENMNFLEYLKNLQPIEIAAVSLIPPDAFFRIALDEASLREVGCTYVSKEKSHIANIIDILDSSDIRIASPHEGAWEPRQGIFLTLTDGSEVKLLFGQTFTDIGTIRGEFTHLHLSKEYFITADKSMINKIYRWAAKADVPVNKIDSNIINCGNFISKFSK